MDDGQDLYPPAVDTLARKLIQTIVEESGIKQVRKVVEDELKRETGKLPPLPDVRNADDSDTECDDSTTSSRPSSN